MSRTLFNDDADRLRTIARWMDGIHEDIWYPEHGKPATSAAIIQLYSVCRSWDVDYPSDLVEHEDPKAASAWFSWCRRRDS